VGILFVFEKKCVIFCNILLGYAFNIWFVVTVYEWLDKAEYSYWLSNYQVKIKSDALAGFLMSLELTDMDNACRL